MYPPGCYPRGDYPDWEEDQDYEPKPPTKLTHKEKVF